MNTIYFSLSLAFYDRAFAISKHNCEHWAVNLQLSFPAFETDVLIDITGSHANLCEDPDGQDYHP